MFVFYNANPNKNRVGDCTVRAISTALNLSWETVYTGLAVEGMQLLDMPSANAVWGSYLKKNGFSQNVIYSEFPECTTVKDFCEQHTKGVYILALSGHVVAVINGNYYDTWDSGDEIPIYYWEKIGE